MSGHSQFKNIMHRKGAQDKKRAKIFTKLIRELTSAARSGLPDPAANPRASGPRDGGTRPRPAAGTRAAGRGTDASGRLRMALAGDIRHRVRGRRTLFAAEEVRRAAG